MTNKIIVFLKRIVDMGRQRLGFLLFPPRCPVCDGILEPEQFEKGIHSYCESKLFPICGAVCMHCGRPFPKNLQKNPQKKDNYFDNSVKEYCMECFKRGYAQEKNVVKKGKALYLYRGAIKKVMYRFKYSNKREYAAFFAKHAVDKYPWLFDVEAIIPVPMYSKKQKLRGYNQAEVFARTLSDLTEVPVDHELLLRVVDTTPQKGLDDMERKNNLKNAFQKGKSIVKYKKVLIVDDIYTTGATVETVAEELKGTGISQVYTLCICIGGEM